VYMRSATSTSANIRQTRLVVVTWEARDSDARAGSSGAALPAVEFVDMVRCALARRVAATNCAETLV
jgi:hypothetical protein